MNIYELLLMASDVVLVLSGATMFWFSPRLRRHWILGYGSPRSMINDSTWQAANRFAGMTLSLLTLVVMFLHVSLWQLIEMNDVAQTLTAAFTLSLPLVVMYLTEKYLGRRFRN
jgi:uncharacterized membrane protein